MPQLETPALPNIKGWIGLAGAGYGSAYTYGSFSPFDYNTNTENWGESTGGNLWYISSERANGNQRYGYSFKASQYNNIYKESHNDVTPYNFNINIYVKV